MTAETTVRTEPQIHGRSTQLRAVSALLDRTATAGAVLVVTGEPGLGRTALLAHAAGSFTAGPVLRTRAEPAGRREPLGHVRQLIREIAALTGTAAAPCAGRADIDRTAGGPADSGGAVTGPMGNGRAGSGGAVADSADMDSATEALLGVLRAAAEGRPLLVCVDDAHHWDGPSRAVLARACTCLPAVPGVGLLLTLAAHRAAGRDFTGLPTAGLHPLTPPQASALLDDVTGGDADPAVREELLEEAGGNPALLLALVRRLSPAALRGTRPLPRPAADAATLTEVVGDHLVDVPDDAHDLLLTVATALRESDDPTVDAGLVRRAVRRLREGRGPGDPAVGAALAGRAVRQPGESGGPAAGAGPKDSSAGQQGPPAGQQRASAGQQGGLPDVLVPVDGGFRFAGDLIGRAVYAGAAPESRRAAHRALAAELSAAGRTLPALLHRAWATAGPAPRTAAELSAAAETSPAAPHLLRAVAHTRAAELTPEGPDRAARCTAAAEHALLAGRPHRALRLLATARCWAAPAETRGRAELVRGTAALRDGPVADAHESLLLAASLLAPAAPDTAARAALAAADAAWAAGDMRGCLAALREPGFRGGEPHQGSLATAPARNPPRAAPATTDGERLLLADYRLGTRAVLEARLDQALEPLRRVVARAGADVRPQALLKSAAAGLLLGDVAAARRAGARALAATRNLGPAALVPQALEYLAYAELRAGRHTQARAHAEEGLRTAHLTGQRNTAAQHHAVLALTASIEDDPAAVAHHVSAALATARRHGLAQAATLAEWAAARADLGRGRPLDAADRLGPLVRPGRRRGHFAVWMLAVPCYVEAAVLAGRPDDARTVVAEFALWADFGADPHAPAQHARCHALLAGPDETDALYRRALALHEEADGDFERARTELLYGKWLRRRRRLREARDRLGAALVGFERCGARAWAEQARGELRANGAAPHGTGPARTAPHGTGPDPLAVLTPQQLRITRHVAEGATNREVALRLAVSTRTVDYHLRNVFAAVGVRSRVELARLVEQAEKNGKAEEAAVRA